MISRMLRTYLPDCWHTMYGDAVIVCEKHPAVDNRHWLWQMLLPLPPPYDTCVCLLDSDVLYVTRSFYNDHWDSIHAATDGTDVSLQLVNCIELA